MNKNAIIDFVLGRMESMKFFSSRASKRAMLDQAFGALMFYIHYHVEDEQELVEWWEGGIRQQFEKAIYEEAIYE